MISELETHEDMLSPWKDEYDGGHDTHLECERPGFPIEAHIFFRIANCH